MRTVLTVLVFAFAISFLPGCGGATMAKVKGKVMYDGKPVKQAQVTFALTGTGQKETGKPAAGFTADDGTFELSTFKDYDGALIGSHHVHVMIDDTNPARCKRTKDLTLEVKPGITNEFTIELDPK